MWTILKLIFNYLVFPGFCFAAIAGLAAWGIERKITARLQWRLGPPWYQNFIDIAKLLQKEIIVPEGRGKLFLWAPLLGVAAAFVVSGMLGMILQGKAGFPGDILVIIYLLLLPAVALILGGSSSANALASVGASREMKLVLAYELPFLLALLAVLVKTRSYFSLAEILLYQQQTRSLLFSLSGFLAFAVCLFCVQAKLGFAPFDISEAEQEITGGVLIEYSGLPLALFRLTKAILIYALPLLLIGIFIGKDISWGFLLVKYLGVVLLVILLKNTNPRLRIDQAMHWFWARLTPLAGVSLVLAFLGL